MLSVLLIVGTSMCIVMILIVTVMLAGVCVVSVLRVMCVVLLLFCGVDGFRLRTARLLLMVMVMLMMMMMMMR